MRNMKKIKIYLVDAFTDKLYSGNPAAVCILDNWPNDSVMQSIAVENNLAETAFILPRTNDFEIRWFTPAVEVDLCGHAKLAMAFVYFQCLDYKKSVITFQSVKSGELKVPKQDNYFMGDFPNDVIKEIDFDKEIAKCIGIEPIHTLKGKSDYMAVLKDEHELANLHPDFGAISKLKSRGLIVTAKGNHVDFVSRFFAPQSGINEDPVTGSAHTSLIPYWSAKLRKAGMIAKQLSKRGGDFICKHKGDRSLIGGKACLYMVGEIVIE